MTPPTLPPEIEAAIAAAACVRRHGGDGKLTITISLEPVGDAIDITTSFRSKKPHAPIPATKVWADEEGALRTTDPLQEVLPFRRPKGPRETT